MTDDDIFAADLRLLVGGQRLVPTSRNGRAVIRFLLPATNVRLVSRVNRPCDLGINGDVRLLGISVRGLSLTHAGASTQVGPDALRLLPGFHLSPPGETLWTAGEAHLPDAWFAAPTGEMLLEIEGATLPAYQDASSLASANHMLFMGFENLGESCDFSIAQHHYNTHPTSLLRWGSTDLSRLLAGLESGFAGLGDPARTELAWSERAREYKLRDARYLSAHTWANQHLDDPAAREQIRLAGCARLRLLARKLMADLRAPRRIYVFKPTQGPMALSEFRRLHETLRQIGLVQLLCVNPGATLAQAGQVEAVGDGLFIGHIDRTAHNPEAPRIWHRLCTLTARMAAAETTPQPVASHA